MSKEIIKYKCKECGKKVLEKDLHYMDNDRLIKEKLCFTCDFWMKKVKTIKDPNWVRVNNESYYIGDETEKGFRGFDSRKFIIKFNNGKIIETTNLWHQGEIPQHFRKRLFNNAEFIK